MKARIPGSPPNKSNSYQIARGKGGRPTLITSQAVRAFEDRLRTEVQQELARLGHDANIHVPAPSPAEERRQARTGKPIRKRPKVGAPLYLPDHDLYVQVTLGRSDRRGIDIDGVKAILDACNLSGVWLDDREVGRLLIRRVPTSEPFVEVEIAYDPDPGRWDSPVVMRRRDWFDVKKKQEELEAKKSVAERATEEIVIYVHCARCGVGIGRNTDRKTAWYWPIVKGGQETLRLCCEECARELGFLERERWRQLTAPSEQDTISAARILERALAVRQERKVTK